jgi:hypothetical protein
MLSRCANPLCSKKFHYLGDGKLFQVELPSESPGAGAAGNLVSIKQPRRGKIERFWLCNDCAAQMTLIFAPETGITVAPLQKVQRAAAS